MIGYRAQCWARFLFCAEKMCKNSHPVYNDKNIQKIYINIQMGRVREFWASHGTRFVQEREKENEKRLKLTEN